MSKSGRSVDWMQTTGGASLRSGSDAHRPTTTATKTLHLQPRGDTGLRNFGCRSIGRRSADAGHCGNDARSPSRYGPARCRPVPGSPRWTWALEGSSNPTRAGRFGQGRLRELPQGSGRFAAATPHGMDLRKEDFRYQAFPFIKRSRFETQHEAPSVCMLGDLSFSHPLRASVQVTQKPRFPASGPVAEIRVFRK